MAARIAPVRIPGGIATDGLPSTIPPEFWTSGLNVVFREQAAELGLGLAQIAGDCTVCSPQHLVAWNADESFLLGAAPSIMFYAGPPYAPGVIHQIGQVETSTSTHANVSPASWVAAPVIAGQYTGGQINGIAYFNHPGMVPVDFRAGTPFSTLADWVAYFGAGYTCTALRHFKEFYVAMGVRVGSIIHDADSFYWSNRASPRTSPVIWTPAATNAAGSAALTGGGEMVDAVPMQDTLLIFKRRAVWAGRVVGGNFVWDFQKALDGIGMLSQNCGVVVGSEVVWLTEDDVVAWSGGGTPRSLLDGRARRQIQAGINDANFRNSWLTYLPRQKEIWVCPGGVGGSGYPSEVITINSATGAIGTRNPSFLLHAAYLREATAVGVGKQGQTVIAVPSGVAGQLRQVDSGSTVGGVTVAGSVERRGLDLGAPDKVKLVQWVRPWVEAPGAAVAMSVQVAATQTPNATPSYGAAQVFTTGTTDKVHFLVKGRFLHFKFSTTAAAPWKLPGFDVGWELAGSE